MSRTIAFLVVFGTVSAIGALGIEKTASLFLVILGSFFMYKVIAHERI